jgi:predicted PurR-regulated permease PerM
VLPITFALLLTFVFSPIIRALGRIRIPPPLGAALVVLALLTLLGAGGYALSGAATEWLARAPQTLSAATARLSTIRRPVEQMTKTAEQVTRAAGVTATPRAREVVVAPPSIVARLFGTTEAFLAALLEVIVLVYFLLAAGDLFLQKLIKILPTLGDKKTAVLIARQVETSASIYLITVTLINLGEGLAVAGVLSLLRMPNPLLWGVLVACFEFIPYLGATAMVLILSLAALTTFDSVGHALMVPGSYLVINILQANFISPLLLGRRLTLNPVAIFVGLILWFFLWGVPGAFIAVPLLAMFKIFCDHIRSLAPIGEFLGKRDDS